MKTSRFTWNRRMLNCNSDSVRRRRQQRLSAAAEIAEQRIVMSANPVLMVISDQRDFYYQEYSDTRISLENAGVSVAVAAASIIPSQAHAGTGQGAGSGIVVPDLALADVDPADYSAIVFVGGWGSSMYQYSFPGDYQDNLYDGNLATRQMVNDLINDFVEQDKYVTAICHGVTVLAWARVDGQSPLNGRQVSVPFIGSPAVFYNNTWYGNYQLGQREQIVQNGGLANSFSGQYGDPATVADDVIVDGRIITAENYDSAVYFGTVIAQQVLAAAAVNHPPVAVDDVFAVPENSPAGTFVGQVSAMDPNVGQTLTYSLASGNIGGAFAINAVTGQILVANAAVLDFETTPQFQLVVNVTDNGTPSLSDSAVVTIQLQDVVEQLPTGVHRVGNDVVVQGTAGPDVIYLWSSRTANDVGIWMNGTAYGTWTIGSSSTLSVRGGDGNDRIFGTDLYRPVSIFGEGGHDLMTGGNAADTLDGGAGVDRISGMAGDDILLGGADNDFLYGLEGNDVLIGGGGADVLEGGFGRDILIGGSDRDRLVGGADDDVMISASTLFDQNEAALREFRTVWVGPGSASSRAAQLASGTSSGFRLVFGESLSDDNVADVVIGGGGADLLLVSALDELFSDSDDLFAFAS